MVLYHSLYILCKWRVHSMFAIILDCIKIWLTRPDSFNFNRINIDVWKWVNLIDFKIMFLLKKFKWSSCTSLIIKFWLSRHFWWWNSIARNRPKWDFFLYFLQGSSLVYKIVKSRIFEFVHCVFSIDFAMSGNDS